MNKEELISATEIAKLLLSFDQGREYFRDGKMPKNQEEQIETPTIGNFRLNKMLHICYMLHYSKYEKPLFWEDLRAYQWGAVVYPIYKNFFSLYREPLKPEEITIEPEKKDFISKIFHYFKNYSDKDLETFSHDDIAWRERWNSHREEDEDKMVINEEVKGFYRDILKHIVREVELS